MVLIENWLCNNLQEATQRERYWIEHFKAQLNQVIPGRTNKEYYQDNLEKIKQYRKDNKQKISKYNHNYSKTHRNSINKRKQLNRMANVMVHRQKSKEYREKHKDAINKRCQKYYQNNKEHIQQKRKEYREQNKEKMSQDRSQKITCECGIVCSKQNIYRHRKSQQHQEFIKNKISNINKDAK